MASDIVMRLRRWLEFLGINTSGGQLLDEAAAEIARLVAEVERHRMTAEERGMAASAVDFMSEPGVDPEPLAMLAEINALRGYLDRTAPKEVGRE